MWGHRWRVKLVRPDQALLRCGSRMTLSVARWLGWGYSATNRQFSFPDKDLEDGGDAGFDAELPQGDACTGFSAHVGALRTRTRASGLQLHCSRAIVNNVVGSAPSKTCLGTNVCLTPLVRRSQALLAQPCPFAEGAAAQQTRQTADARQLPLQFIRVSV